MDEFTRGIDVGAKVEMLAVITRLAAEGMSIIIVSSEFEELVESADRILVLARGRLIASSATPTPPSSAFSGSSSEVEDQADEALET